jgi:hypothetical protein
MASLQSRLSDLITAFGTDVKQLRTWITGSSSGNLTGLTTTDKTNLVSAINEVKAGSSGAPPDASETVKGILELATQAETDAGTDDARAVTALKLATRIAAYAQPLDADLTSIAAVSTTAFGRGLLALADAAGLAGQVAASSETVAGKIEIATQTETNTGTDDARAVTPLKFQTRMAAFAMPLSYLDTSTALGTSDAKVPSQNAVKAYADALIGANNAMVYKGVIDASATPNYPAANAGDTYKISVAGKIGGASGLNVEVGDLIMCTADGTASGTQVAVGASWDVIQVNIDGAVVGPASAVSGQLASFSGTTGKLIADSGLAIDTDGTMAANSNTKIPSQAATRTYIGTTNYTKTELGNPDTDLVALYNTAKA